jgi:hypothetical protein
MLVLVLVVLVVLVLVLLRWQLLHHWHRRCPPISLQARILSHRRR